MSTISERYKKWKAGQSSQPSFGHKFRTWNAPRVARDIYDRTNTWLTNTGAFIDEYKTRYGGENTSYRADASDYYNASLERTGAFDTEADEILALMNRYGEYYDDEFKNSITSALSHNRASYGTALDYAKSDMDSWGQWESEDEYDYAKYYAEAQDIQSRIDELRNSSNGNMDTRTRAEIDRLTKEQAAIYDIMMSDTYEKYNAAYRYAENEKKIAALEAQIEEEYYTNPMFRAAQVAGEQLSTMISNPGGKTRFDQLKNELNELKDENDRLLKYADPKKYEEYQNLSWGEKALNTALDVVHDLHYGAVKSGEDVVDFINTVGTAGAKALSDIGIELGTRTGLMSEGMARGHRARAEEKEAERIEKIKYNWSRDNLLLGGKQHDYYDDKNLLSGNTVANDLLTNTAQGVGRLLPNVALSVAAPALSASGYVNAATNLTNSIPGLSKAIFALGAAGSGANEAFELGANSMQAFGYGAATGALETATEALGGMVFGEAVDLGSTAVGKFFIKHGLDKYVSQGVGKYAYAFASEGLEEVLSDVASPAIKAAFDIGDAQDKYFGSNWQEGWNEVRSGLPETFAVGGLVGITMQGLQSGASALMNADKGGFKYNSIADQMSIIDNAIKVNEVMQASSKLNEQQKKAAKVQLDKTIEQSISQISQVMASLSENQRNAVFEEAPILASFIDENGEVVADIGSDNIYLSEKDIENYLKAGSRRNLNRQQRYESGQSIIISSEAELVSFVEKSIDGASNEMVAYGKVSERLAADIRSKSNTKVDVSGAYLELLSDDLQHSYREHATAKEQGDLDMTKDDLIFALKNVNKGEVVSARQYKDGGQRVVICVPTTDGMMMLVELASKSAGTLRLKTGWKVSNNKFEQKYRSSTSTTGRNISTNAVHDDTASNNSISQPDGIVNRENLSSVDGQVVEYARILKIGEQGVRDLNNVISSMGEGVDIANAVQAFNAVYQAGKQGKDISEARNPHLQMLSAEQKEVAYNAGFMDSVTEKKSSDGVLQKDGESGKINKDKESTKNEQGVHIREGGKRNDGENTSGQVSAVESGTGEAEEQGSGSSQEARTARIRAFVEVEGLKKVGSISLVSSGTETENVVVLPESAYDDGMRQIVEDQAAQGRKVIFVSGALEFVEDGKTDVAQGLISEDGKTMWIQADGAISPEQIALHEEYHAIVKADPSLVDRMRKKINKKYKGKLDLLTKMYASLYFTDANGKVPVTTEYILEEIFADAYAGIDVFEVISDAAARATDIQEDIRDGTKALQSTRAPPSNSGIKASRSNKDIYISTDDFIRDVVKEDRSSFTSQLSSKTKNIESGEIKRFEIYGAKRIYFFRADGYMTGEVLKSVSNKRPNLWKRAREEFLNAIERSGESPSIWVEFDTLKEKGYFDYSGFSEHGQTTIGDDSISEESPSSIGTGSVRSNGENHYSKQEIDILIEALIESLNHIDDSSGGNSSKLAGQNIDLTTKEGWEAAKEAIMELLYEDDGEIKASRSLRSPEDVAQAYLDAVPNRLILANAFESQATDQKAKELLQKYKDNLSTIESKQAELDKTKRELKDLYFSKGKRNVEKIKTLEQRRDKLQKIIDNADRWLLKYEEMKPIRDLIEREKTAAYKKAVAEGKNKLAEYRERVKAREEEIKQGYREARKRASDRRRSSDIRKKIKEFKDKLQKTLQHPTEKKYIPGALAQAMIDVCELINTDTDVYKADGSVNKAQQKRIDTWEKLARLREEYKKISTDTDDLVRQEFDEEISGYLEKLESDFKGKSLNDMSRAELEEMYDILHSIDETLRNARKLLGEKDATDVYEAGDAVISEQKEIANKRKNGKRNVMQKLNDGVGNASLSPMRRVLEICGYNKDSALYKLFKQLEAGVRKAEFFKMGAKKSFEALTTKKYADVYEKAIYQADGGEKYTDIDGRRFGISKMGKMQAILSFEREVANKKTHHVEKGGLVFADLRELGKGRLKTAVDAEHSHKVAGADAVRLIEQFKAELEFDRWAQKYMAAARFFFNVTAKNAINDTYMQLKHRILATDDAYIPFEVDQNSIVKEITGENDIQQTISSYGMLKDMQKGASNPLIITGLNNVLERHIEQVGTIQGLAIPIRNFNKIWNVKSTDGLTTVKEQIQKAAGNGALSVITQTVRDLQGDRPRSDKSDGISRAYKKVKSNYISATFFANVSVMLKQIGSMFSATTVIGYRDPVRMMGNLIYTFANSEKIAAEVDKYTATAWMRRQGLSDAELKTLATERRKTKVGKFFDKIGSGGMIAMDYNVALSLWKYAKQDVSKKTGLRGEELLKATAEYYDEVIETTQSMTDVLHRPEIQRSGGIGTEMLGTFKTDLYQNAGNLRMAIGEFAQNQTKENAAKLAKTVGSIMTSALWGSVVTSLIAILRYKPDRYRDEEDDELTVESWLKVQGMDLLQELAGYIVPIAGSELVEAVINRKSGGSWGNVIASAIPYDAVNDLYSDICTISQKIEDDKDLKRSDYYKIIKDCGNVFGLPTSNVLRTLEAIRLHIEDFKNGELFSFEAGLEDPNAYRLYKAMLADDADKIDKASRNFKNGAAITKAIRSQLRERDPRIKEAAAALDDGNVRRWSEIYDAILGEGHFDEADIKAAIESERDSYSSKIKSAAQAKFDNDEDEYARILDELFESFETVFSEENILDDIDTKQSEIAEGANQPKEAYSKYESSYMNEAFDYGDSGLALEILNELLTNKTDHYFNQAKYEAGKNGDQFNERRARREAEEKAESALQSSVTSYWKPRYVEAYENGDQEELKRIRDILDKTGFYDSVSKTVSGWVK